MTGKELLLGMDCLHSKYVLEAEMYLLEKTHPKIIPVRRLLMIAAIIGLMLFLLGSAVVSMVKMRVTNIGTVVVPSPTAANVTANPKQKQEPSATSVEEETVIGEEIHFDEVHNIYIELEDYYPQVIPEGYSMTFVSEGAPLSQQGITYENAEGDAIDYRIYVGDPASSVEIFDIAKKTGLMINGNRGILYEQTNGRRTLVWVDEQKGYGCMLRTMDKLVDLIAMADSTAEGEPLVPTNSEQTQRALEQFGEYRPQYLPDGYAERSTMGWPLESGTWYSYVRKWFINKTENKQIYLEYETYRIVTEDGYRDDAETICSFFIPGYDVLKGIKVGEEVEIDGMFGIATERDIAWADTERKVIFHLYSKDVTGAELLKVAQSIKRCDE